MKLLIVGGVAGGASAATRARRLSASAEILVFERGPDVSFANCGLPYYIGGAISDRAALLVAHPEQLAGRHHLDVRTRTEITAIDRARRCVTAVDHARGRTYEESYDKLILAMGAAPLRPPLPGLDLPGVFTLRNLEDTDRIRSAVDAGTKSAVVVGAGFIGLELVENLHRRGIATTLIELQDQVLPPLDRELTTPIRAALRDHGIALRLGQSATAIESRGAGLEVVLNQGDRLPADLVVLGIGVKPENALAVAAGLEVGPRGGVRVDEHMRTSDPDIYAVGDLVETRDYVTNGPTQVPLAGPANRQGRIAADHALGRDSRYRGTQGTAIVRVFDTTAAVTGLSAKALDRAGLPYRVVYVHPSHHAGYHPGAQPMTIKLMFDPNSGAILGAEIVGGEGVDKRIDVLATAIQARFTVFDLEEAELAYAPQFGSAKDPINMAGFVAANVLRGDNLEIQVPELDSPEWHDALRLDVRSEAEFRSGAIPNAWNVPVDQLRETIDAIPENRKLVVYCQSGQRGYLASRLLRQEGRDARNLSGGFKTYRLFHPPS